MNLGTIKHQRQADGRRLNRPSLLKESKNYITFMVRI
nr:MAG TPA: hypothetical protein [Caudoviricetes sp.]